VLFFKADTGGRQIRGIHQPHRPRLPEIIHEQRPEQALVDPPQPSHPHATAKLVQNPHAGHLGLAAQAGELSPRALLRQQFDQQVHRMHRRQQAQQMEPIQLGRTVLPPPPARVARRPALVDEIVGHKRMQEFKQGRRTGGRKVGIHVRSLPLEFQPVSDPVAIPGILAASDCPGDGCTNFRNTLSHVVSAESL
jgi:hypothetical protein